METYELKTADGIPTFVYNQDRSISIGALAMQQAIDAFTGGKYNVLFNSLKVGRIPNIDYVENNGGTTTFRYDHSLDSGVAQPASYSEATQERHFIIINGG